MIQKLDYLPALLDRNKDLSIPEMQQIAEALRCDTTAKTLELAKSIGAGVAKKRQSMDFDPLTFNFMSGMNYKEKVATLDYASQRAVAKRNGVVSAIINTRINQVFAFARQVDISENTSGNKSIGFKIANKFKPDSKFTRVERKFKDDMEDFLSDCGYTHRYSQGKRRPKFPEFLKQITRDRLTFDQVNFELIPNRKREPAEFFAVDPATIRFSTEEDIKKGVAFVQIINGSVKAEFTFEEMAMGICNPRTDITANGYGQSEIEQLVKIIVSQMNADNYNDKFFSQGLGGQGILNMVTKDGKIPEEVLNEFRQQLVASATGVQNAWKTLVTNADKLEWINLKSSNRDMEFKSWLEYLIKICCAVYQIAPEEINFNFGGGGGAAGGSGALFETSPESIRKYSKDKGLRPLLHYLEDTVTEYVIEPYDEDWCLTFVGLDMKSEKEIIDNRNSEVKGYKTVDEVRGESGLKLLGEENGGNLILDPQYISWLAQQQMAKQMEQGEEGEEEESSPFDVDDTEGE